MKAASQRSARLPTTLAILGALAVAPCVAHAQRAESVAPAGHQNLLELGRQQYEDLRYEEAVQTLSAAIIRRGNSRETEVQLYELIGLAYLALNRNDEAEGAFRLMLQRDPEHHLSTDVAPRIIEFFNGVKQRWDTEGQPGRPREGQTPPPPPAPVTIEHRSPAQQRRNVAVDLTATVLDPGQRVSRMVLAFRGGSHGLFARANATREADGVYRAVIPAGIVRPPLVEYYFEALGEDGVPLQARGDAYAPLRVAVPEPGGIPVWIWPVGGAVVVGAVVAIVLAVTQTAPGHLDIHPVPGM